LFQIARRTGRDIYQVPISETKSKWFGESERLIKSVFDRYLKISKDMTTIPILFFNEADGIFSSRKKTGDNNVEQTENAIQNIILQEMEDFSGILIARISWYDEFQQQIGSSAQDIVSPGALRCDNNGNPYFTSRLSGSNVVNFDPNGGTVNVSNSALYLASFSPDGNLRFAEGFNSGAGDGGHRVVFDNQNNVYMAGWMNGTVNFGQGIIKTAYSPTADVFISKFTNNGDCLWAFNFGGLGSTANNICAGLSVDQENNPIITGQLYGTDADVDPGSSVLNLSSAGNNDCFLIKYTSNSQL